MIGDGVDMYDLVLDIHDVNDIHLVSMKEHIWIGVIEKLNPSPPVPRNRTTCYSNRPVFMYKGRRVFSMIKNYKTNEFDFYYIPDDEFLFVEKDILR